MRWDVAGMLTVGQLCMKDDLKDNRQAAALSEAPAAEAAASWNINEGFFKEGFLSCEDTRTGARLSLRSASFLWCSYMFLSAVLYGCWWTMPLVAQTADDFLPPLSLDDSSELCIA